MWIGTSNPRVRASWTVHGCPPARGMTFAVRDAPSAGVVPAEHGGGDLSRESQTVQQFPYSALEGFGEIIVGIRWPACTNLPGLICSVRSNGRRMSVLHDEEALTGMDRPPLLADDVHDLTVGRRRNRELHLHGLERRCVVASLFRA